MKPTVYIETTVISYLVARSTADLIRRAQREVTKDWWENRRSAFSLFTSQFVLDEASMGDSWAAAKRLAALDPIDLLDISPNVEPFARRLLDEGAMPAQARIDALHLAVATVNGMQYLLTWNCKHLANAVRWPMIERACRAAGFSPPAICTPYELFGG
jgi:hypothetical protein